MRLLLLQCRTFWQEVRATCENVKIILNSPGPKPLCLAYIQPFVCVTVKKNEPTALNAKNLNALFWDIKIPNPTGQDNEWQMKE